MKQSCAAILTLAVLVVIAIEISTLSLSRSSRESSVAKERHSDVAGQPASSSELEQPEPKPHPEPAPEPAAKPAPKLVVVREVAGQSVEGRPIPLITLGSGEYTVLMMASIHGNEAAGTPLLERLAKLLEDEPEQLADRTLVLMPVVNPDGVAADRRFNARDVDLNRNFPANNRQNSRRYGMEALSEPEALVVFQVMARFVPNHIVTLHQPLECVDYDGPAAALAEAMSRCCLLPVKKLGSRPGSLGSYAGVTIGVPTVTFELPKIAREQTPDKLWALYGEALRTAARFTHAEQ
jgi:murein peptide amidase A